MPSKRFFKYGFLIVLIFISIGPTILGAQETQAAQEAGESAQAGEQEAEVYAFGYDIFKAPPEPIIEGPVDETYLISPGDEMLITVWGDLSLEYPLTVSEDGYIDIPDEGGRVYTNGVTLGELKGLVADKLSQIYSSYINVQNPAASSAFVDVKITKARKLLVYVVGEVQNQGMYTIGSSVATVLNLLINAGGVKQTGSLREIKVRRTDGRVDIIDIYDFILGKIETKTSRLGYGDFVIVPLKQKTVTIKGEVRKPGKFELVGDEGIKDLIQFAGGLNPNAYLDRCQVRRFELNLGEKFIDFNLAEIYGSPDKDFSLQDGDEVSVFKNIVVRRRMVEIRGAGIKRPGLYQYSAGMTLKDLIAQAEGLKEDVYLERADLVRTEEDFSKRLRFFPLSDLYREEQPGRFVFFGNEEDNFALKELDQITVYSSFEMAGQDKQVSIRGHVREPGTYVLPENMTLFDLIFSRGGFQDEEFKKRAYLDLAHVFRKSEGELEERIITFNLRRLLEGEKTENFPLEDMDRIVVYSRETMETKPFVTVGGLVLRPGTYPVAEDMTLEDLILLAGGLRPDAYRVEAVIGRMDPSLGEEEERISTIVVPLDEDFASKPQERKTPVKAYDDIVVRNLPDWEPLPVVSVQGEVKYPGSYSFMSHQERLSGAIRRAGGIKPGAFPEGAYLMRRTSVIEMNREAQGDRVRVAISLKEALNDPGGSYDLFLEDGDQIYVPLNPGSVEVKGAVENPGLFQYKKGQRLAYYIDLCGGYRRDADTANTVIFLPNKSAIKKNGFLFFGGNPSVQAGSVIDVPFIGEEEEIDVVELRGAVERPMVIQFRRGQKLDYYIELCGGFSPDADRENMVIYFADGQILESAGNSSFNPYLLPGCVVEVPFLGEEEELQVGFIDIQGAVKNPMFLRYREGETLDYYIRFCGGFTADADKDKIVIHLPDGSTLEKRGSQKFNPVIPRGGVIEVPFKEEIKDLRI